MELLLELRCRGAGGVLTADVTVELDAEATVGALTEALADYADRQAPGSVPPAAALVRLVTGATSGGQAPLDPGALVVDAGLVNGQTVLLAVPAAGEQPEPPGDALVCLDVVAGPQAGRSVPLLPGAHSVGRATTSAVVVGDATLSPRHFDLAVADDGEVELSPDLQAPAVRLGDRSLDGATTLPEGQEIRAGASTFVVRRVAPDETRRLDRLGLVPFNRVPYRRPSVERCELPEVPAPPQVPDKRPLSLVAVAAPAASAGGMAVMTGRLQFLAFAALSPVLMVYRHVADRRGGRRRFRRQRAEFLELVDRRAADVDEALARERAARLCAAPDLGELAHQAVFHMPRLWERDRDAGDLLALRLGLGEQPSQVSLGIGPGGDEELAALVHERLAHHASVERAPVVVDLVALGAFGLCGVPTEVAGAALALLVQAACQHSPEDLVLAAAVGETGRAGFEWLKWLPHVRSSTSPLDGDHLAVGPEATRALLVNLLAVAADRSARRGPGSGTALWPRLLVAVDETTAPDRALLSQLLDVAPAVGIHLLWLGDSDLQVPRQCRAVARCPRPGAPATVRFTDPTVPEQVLALDGTGPATARTIAMALAPLRDASAASQTTAIPRVVPLLDVAGVDTPTGDAVAESWTQPRPYGLAFPIGLSAEGPLHLDLVEQGPHTLIGGTSGAGKSELLQTLVLSLAATYPPTRLTFLFVDYKGGASSAAFRDLPHTVGYVTNLSGRLSLRALTSLKAELQRRMRLLEGRAKDLAEMLAVAPEDTPPSLVIVVDEFAALVKEVPDFLAGVVDIAQRGRSLGVHLILATQRPTGVVNDNILANTNLRISLRMLDAADSNNVIGSRDAADIPVPLRGRGYVRSGPQTRTPFQCAWSGAPMVPSGQARAIDVRAFEVGPATADVADGADPEPGQGLGADEPRTQLDVLVAACADAARSTGLPPARRPWVEPLGPVVRLQGALDRLPAFDDPGRVVVVGLDDDPEHQAQHVAVVDLEASGGLLVFGTGGSGKTTLLRTVAVGLALQGTPDEVQFHVLDFASRALDPLADLPHCGDVVPGDDVERATRLLTVMEREIERRRTVLAEARTESLSALRTQSASTVMPRIVLLLDSYSGFHGTFDRADRYPWQQLFQRIVSQGRQVGIHCVLTTERRIGVPPALLSAVSARLVLRMATPEELSALGVPAATARDADLPAGRGFLDGTTEVQVACVSDDPVGVAQSRVVAAVAAGLTVPGGARAPRLPELPGSVALAARPSVPLTCSFGVVDLTLTEADVDLRRQNLVVMGPPLSGRSTALETVAQGLRASTGLEVGMFALGAATSPLADLDVWDDAAFARGLYPGLLGRLAERLQGGDGTAAARAVLFVDTAEDVDGSDVAHILETLTRSESLRLAVACEAGTVTKAYSGWLSPLRRNRSAVLLQPGSRGEVEAALGVQASLRPDQAFPPGRGIYVADRRWSLLQVGLCRADRVLTTTSSTSPTQGGSPHVQRNGSHRPDGARG